MVGYSGSQNPSAHPNPTYENIMDYAESIRVTFDPTQLSYTQLLDMFFAFHTPADPRFCTTQYCSAIFYHTAAQREAALQAVAARGALGKFVAVEPASAFYQAEDYHQKYIEKQMVDMFNPAFEW